MYESFKLLSNGMTADLSTKCKPCNRAVLDGPLADEAEPALHLVEPRSGGGCEVKMAAFSDHLAGGRIQGGEQHRGSVPDAVMGAAFDVAQSQRQRGPIAIECLDPALLVDTQHLDA